MKSQLKKTLNIMMVFCMMLGMLVFSPPMNVQAASVSSTDVINYARNYVGKVSYVSGGTTIDGSNPGADCSGFICRIYEHFGINMWSVRTHLRDYSDAYNLDSSIVQQVKNADFSSVKPGDIFTFKIGGSGHVAIYAGDGKIIHCSGQWYVKQGSYKYGSMETAMNVVATGNAQWTTPDAYSGQVYRDGLTAITRLNALYNDPVTPVNPDSCGCSTSYAGYYQITADLNVNSGHNYTSQINGSLYIPKGTIVYVSKASKSAGQRSGYAHTSYNGYDGYIATAFMKAVSLSDVCASWGHDICTNSGKEPTCTENGYTSSSTCTRCNSVFALSEVIYATGHDYNTAYTIDKAASTFQNGEKSQHCKKCNTRKNIKTIYRLKTIKLGTTSYTYDGKQKTPTLSIKDSRGKSISANYYSVTRSTGRKNVGKYTYKIKFKNDYKGVATKTLSFKINPPVTSLISVRSEKKGFTAKWKKNTIQTTGFQIQYSTSTKFTNPKTVKITKNSAFSKKITNLKGKKTYYIRVRAYKTVGKTNYYSRWSTYKKVTTRV